ncbi:MAG: alpha/beta hydrolase [Pleurocapsa sp. MO_192.B19]|nr:alpha/beta hydrolase [Pleurocapsa sp. MO_192.B19]
MKTTVANGSLYNHHFISTPDGIRLHAVSCGSFEAEQCLVFIAGWRMSVKWWHQQLIELSQIFRCVAIDMRGYGKSESHTDNNTVPQHAQDLKLVLEHLELESPVVIGWSLGASTILSYVDRFDQQELSAIVLIDQSPKIISDRTWKLGLGTGEFSLDNMKSFLSALESNDEVFIQNLLPQLFATGFWDTIPSRDKHWMVREILKTPTDIASSLLEDHMRRDWRDVLSKISIPTLVVAGGVSQIYPLQSSEYIAQTIEKAQFSVFAHCGHAPFYEEPRGFNHLIKDFVSRLESM